MNEFYTDWDRGWNDFWNGVKQNNCPTWKEQEKRNEWMLGWLAGQAAAEYEREIPEGLTNPE